MEIYIFQIYPYCFHKKSIFILLIFIGQKIYIYTTDFRKEIYISITTYLYLFLIKINHY
jgi:hypothetical protein